MLKTSDYDEPFEVFYDGGCRLCVTEINLLRRLDRRQRIIFTDIGDPKFSAVDETGLSYVELMVRIHGRYASGQLVEGVEVFRQLYARTFFDPLCPSPGFRAFAHCSTAVMSSLRSGASNHGVGLVHRMGLAGLNCQTPHNLRQIHRFAAGCSTTRNGLCRASTFTTTVCAA